MSTTISIPVEDVYPNPRHYREVRPDAVDKLAASIRIVGQLEPIRVFADGDLYVVDAGHHRLAAMKQLGAETIDAIVVDADDVTAMVASNMHFAETEVERSRGTQLMLATGVRPIDAAALVGEKSDRIEKVSRVLGWLPAKKRDMAEDMSLESIAMLDEFAGDEAAIDKLLTTPEKDRARVGEDFRRAKRCEDAVAAARAIVEASGRELLPEGTIAPEGLSYLDTGRAAPDAATHASIRRMQWNGTADITWYGPKGADPREAERAAERERAEKRRVALGEATSRRLGFVGRHLRGDASGGLSNDLRDYAVASWEDGIAADADNIAEELGEIRGFTPRVYAAVLSYIDAQAERALNEPGGWYGNEYGEVALDYFTALASVGYEATAIETLCLAEIRALVTPPASEGADAEEAEPGAQHAVGSASEPEPETDEHDLEDLHDEDEDDLESWL